MIEEHAAAERPLATPTAGRRRDRAAAARGRSTASSASRQGTTRCVAQQRALLLRLGGRQLRPLRRPRSSSTSILVLVSVAIGFAIAFAPGADLPPAPLARSRPSPGRPGVLYTIPSHRLLLPAAADHRARQRHGDDRPHRLHAADHLPQHRRRARQRPADSKDAGRGMGMTDRQLLWRVELPLARARDHRRAPDRHGLDRRDRDPRDVRRRRRARRAALSHQTSTFKTNIFIAGGLAILMAIAFDLAAPARQRLLTPWRRRGERRRLERTSRSTSASSAPSARASTSSSTSGRRARAGTMVGGPARSLELTLASTSR